MTKQRINNIPEELRSLFAWILWKKELRDGKETKVPYSVSGQRASTTDPNMWVSFDEALAALSADYSGLGCVITPPFVGVDIDHCRDPKTGDIDQRGLDAIKMLATYGEISQSGTGLHFWLRGEMPSGGNRRNGVEIYGRGRYFTMTGLPIEGVPPTISSNQHGLAAFHEKYILNGSAITTTTATNGGGIIVAPPAPLDESQSGEDYRKCAELADEFGRDADLMEKAFRERMTYREKWDTKRNGKNYVRYTIDHWLADHPADAQAEAATAVVMRTEMGNAERFLRQHSNEVRRVGNRNRGEWLVWDGKRWRYDSDNTAAELMKGTILTMMDEAKTLATQGDTDEAEKLFKWAVWSQSDFRIQASLRVACTDGRVTASRSDFDRDPMLLSVMNGTLNLRTFELSEYNRGDNLTKLAPVRYDPTAKCPEFEKFIQRILPDPEVRDFVQRWFGYSLTGDNGEQAVFIAYGEGANGKSQLLELFRKLLGGDYAAKGTFEMFRLGSKHGETRNEFARLKGTRLLCVSESGEGVALDEAMVKDVTGGEAITVRFLYKEHFEFVPEFKPTIATNYKPDIIGQDYGIWRRVFLVPFTVTIPESEREQNIHARLLRDEASGILNWALAGLREQQKQGLNPPPKIQAATQAYREEQDTVGQFLTEKYDIELQQAQLGRDTLYQVSARELYAAYNLWAKEAGYKPQAQKRLGQNLVRRGLKSGRDEHGRIVWFGLRRKVLQGGLTICS